jgi:hypothetical protein
LFSQVWYCKQSITWVNVSSEPIDKSHIGLTGYNKVLNFITPTVKKAIAS